jgi:HAD superfamily hydrolase (TIGR01484 family)
MKEIEPDSILLFSDLDGTILNTNNYQIHDSIKNFLKKQSRLNLVLVTSRAWEGVIPYQEDLNLSLPQITENGATIMDPIEGKVLYKKSIPQKSLTRIEKLARKRKIEIGYTPDEKGVGRVSLVLELSGAGKIIKELSTIERIAFVVDKQAGSTNKCLIDITPGAVDKLSGAQKWLELYAGHTHFEKICVAGNSMSDLPLFTQKDFFKVAVEDGAEELKENADIIIPSATQAGFASLLRNLAPSSPSSNFAPHVAGREPDRLPEPRQA